MLNFLFHLLNHIYLVTELKRRCVSWHGPHKMNKLLIYYNKKHEYKKSDLKKKFISKDFYMVKITNFF